MQTVPAEGWQWARDPESPQRLIMGQQAETGERNGVAEILELRDLALARIENLLTVTSLESSEPRINKNAWRPLKNSGRHAITADLLPLRVTLVARRRA